MSLIIDYYQYYINISNFVFIYSHLFLQKNCKGRNLLTEFNHFIDFIYVYENV